jgi:hypothetical protein
MPNTKNGTVREPGSHLRGYRRAGQTAGGGAIAKFGARVSDARRGRDATQNREATRTLRASRQYDDPSRLPARSPRLRHTTRYTELAVDRFKDFWRD